MPSPWLFLIHVRGTETASELARAENRGELESLAAGYTLNLARAIYALTDGQEVVVWPPGAVCACAAQHVVDLWKGRAEGA